MKLLLWQDRDLDMFVVGKRKKALYSSLPEQYHQFFTIHIDWLMELLDRDIEEEIAVNEWPIEIEIEPFRIITKKCLKD